MAGGAPYGQKFLSEKSADPRYTARELSDLTSSVDEGGSLVQQQFHDEVDVNVIVRRFGIGQPVALNTMGVYADFTGIYDYESAMERVRGAEERFMRLPPEVRARFENDPGRLIDAATLLSESEFAKLMDPPAAVVPPVAEVVVS